MYAREEIDLDRSTLADWVGQSSALLAPLVEAINRHVLSGDKVHADDTPVPVLCPGRGTTRQGRLWTYVRDDRPAGLEVPPAVWFAYSPDRKGVHPRRHLQHFTGILQADGYAGFDQPIESLSRVGHCTVEPNLAIATGFGDRNRDCVFVNVEADICIELCHDRHSCSAPASARFSQRRCRIASRHRTSTVVLDGHITYDFQVATDSPLAGEALVRIGELYGIETEIRGQAAAVRQQIRKARAGPKLEALHQWLITTVTQLSKKSDLAGATHYALAR